MANDNVSSAGSQSTAGSTNPDTPAENMIKAVISPKSQLITAQLEENNYLLWKLQIETAVEGYGLEGQKLLPQVIGCKSANDIWQTVEKSFNNQSYAKVMFYKRQLQKIRKDGITMREYLAKIKSMCDLLDAAGSKIPDSEQILVILNGLSEEYEAVEAIISSQKQFSSIDEVHAILLAHEARIESKKIQESDYTVNYASSSSKNKNQSNKIDQTFQRGGPPTRGRGRGTNTNNRPKCQICEKVGHTAPRCFFRFNANFAVNQNPSNQRGSNPTANIAQAQNDVTQSDSSRTQTECARADHINDESWYPDSGATNHITNNLENLNLGNREYKG